MTSGLLCMERNSDLHIRSPSDAAYAERAMRHGMLEQNEVDGSARSVRALDGASTAGVSAVRGPLRPIAPFGSPMSLDHHLQPVGGSAIRAEPRADLAA